MSLESGAQVGQYEIVEMLGVGGMGEVYRARDTRLDRDVAIKILPATLTNDSERVARFEREAKLLASLNHSNIGAIYDFDHVDDIRFLVLEFVEGETLARRLNSGPLILEDALDIARQIAEALDSAHQKGIVHRDLKPANVMVTPDGSVKVLDFGLAKALVDEPSDSAIANSPTITADYTRPGVVLGTAAYMSPEQARGRALDKRSDIWSFGIILFECITGETLFRGETVTDSMGAIMHKEPEWSKLPGHTPPTIQLLLRRCLARDRKRRLHDIADARLELEQAIEDPASTSLGLARAALDVKRSGLTPGRCVLAVALLAVGALAAWSIKPAPQHDAPVLRFTIPIEAENRLTAFRWPVIDIAPNGQHMVFVGEASNVTGLRSRLYIRHMHQLEVNSIDGTENAHTPIFSPDGQWVAFSQDDALKKVSLMGGPVLTVCPADALRGADWAADNTIVFAPQRQSGIYRVSATGGVPREVTTLDPAEPNASHRWPSWLEDGRLVLYTATPHQDRYDQARIKVVDVTTGESRTVLENASHARYVPTGHLVFVRAGVLMAVPFDRASLSVAGEEAPVVEDLLSRVAMGSGQYSFSDNGVLLYVTGSGGDLQNPTWVDQSGEGTSASRHTGRVIHQSLSPSGKYIALAQGETTPDIWIIELERDMLTRLTYDNVDTSPVWSHDDKWVYFSSNRHNGSNNVYRKRADGSGDIERVTQSDQLQWPVDVSPDGRFLVINSVEPDTDNDILVLDLLDEGAEPVPLIATTFREGLADISPDGQWIAYVTNETGNGEVYVQSFPEGGNRMKVSDGRGLYPRWRRDGAAIIYRSGQRQFFSVAVEIEDGRLRLQRPTELFELSDSNYSWVYDVAPHDEKHLFFKNADASQSRSDPIAVVNWFKELNDKAPKK